MKRKIMMCGSTVVLTCVATITGGCTGLESATGGTAGSKLDTTASQVSVGTDLMSDPNDPNLTSGGSGASTGTGTGTAGTGNTLLGNLTPAELSMLQSVLAQVAPGAIGGAANDPNAATSLGGLSKLGLHRRDIALAVLDLVAQQGNLAPQQTFALDAARAYLSHDTSTLLRLMLEPMIASTSGSTKTGN